MPHSAIAVKFGISRARVGQIVAEQRPAQWGFTEVHRAAVRHQETEVLKRLAKAAEQVVSNPRQDQARSARSSSSRRITPGPGKSW